MGINGQDDKKGKKSKLSSLVANAPNMGQQTSLLDDLVAKAEPKVATDFPGTSAEDKRASMLLEEQDRIGRDPDLSTMLLKAQELETSLSSNTKAQDYSRSVQAYEKALTEMTPEQKQINMIAIRQTRYELDQKGKDPEVIRGMEEMKKYERLVSSPKYAYIRDVHEGLSDPKLKPALEKAMALRQETRQATQGLQFDPKELDKYVEKLKTPQGRNELVDALAGEKATREQIRVASGQVREIQDTLEKMKEGEFNDFTAPEPLQNVIEAFAEGSPALLAVNPLTAPIAAFGAIGFNSKAVQIQRLLQAASRDPKLGQIFDNIPYREQGTGEKVATGLAGLAPLLPAFTTARNITGKILPRFKFIPKEGGVPVTPRPNVLVREGEALKRLYRRIPDATENMRRIAHNVITAPIRGAAEFTAVGALTGQMGPEAGVTGASFDVATTVAKEIQYALPGKLRHTRYVSPLIQAIFGGTAFAGGSKLGAEILGQEAPGFAEEFAKGAVLSFWHTSSKNIKSRLSDYLAQPKNRSKLSADDIKDAEIFIANATTVEEATRPTAKPPYPTEKPPVETPPPATPQEAPAKPGIRFSGQKDKPVSKADELKTQLKTKKKAEVAPPEPGELAIEEIPEDISVEVEEFAEDGSTVTIERTGREAYELSNQRLKDFKTFIDCLKA